MAQVSRFFDGPEYGSQDFAEFFTNFLSTGFFTGLDVLANNTMEVTLKEGSAFIEGYEYRNTTDLPLHLQTAHSTNNRIDRVVVRLDRTPDAEQPMTAMIRTGIAGENPVPPELVRNESVYEISLAQILVVAGKSFIEQNQITDERGDVAVCGRVTQPSRLTNQIDSIDIKAVDTPPEQYAEGTAHFYISGSGQAELMQGWLDSIGVKPEDYGRSLSSLRAYVVTTGNKTNTGIQTFTLFAFDRQSDYQIYGEWKRANNAISPGVTWGKWSEVVFVVEKGANENGRFIRYSDGTQRCWGNPFGLSTTESVGALYRSTATPWTFPASFASTSDLVVTGDIRSYDRWVSISVPSTTSISVSAIGLFNSTSNYLCYLEAWGRWR